MPDPATIASTVEHPRYVNFVRLYNGQFPESGQYDGDTYDTAPDGVVFVFSHGSWAPLATKGGTWWGLDLSSKGNGGNVAPGTMAMKVRGKDMLELAGPAPGLILQFTVGNKSAINAAAIEMTFPAIANHTYMCIFSGTARSLCSGPGDVRTYSIRWAGQTVAGQQVGFHRGGWTGGVWEQPLSMSGAWKPTADGLAKVDLYIAGTASGDTLANAKNSLIVMDMGVAA